MDPVIVVTSLLRRFGEVTAVDGLSFTVNRGEIFGCLGHNGAGKTTTVRLLNGLLHPDGGSACVLGRDPVTDGAELRRRTGVLTETPSLEERLSARENLRYFGALYGVAPVEVRQRADALLSLFGLADRADQRVGGYSKGMKQRLALARALLHRPDLLFLDEPAAGLDPIATRQLHELIVELSRSQGTTVFLCTHNLAEAQKLCSRVAVLQQGRLLALGTPAELGQDLAQGWELLVETSAEHQPAALAICRRRPEWEVKSEGETQLSIRLPSRHAAPEVIAALVAAGAPVYQAQLQEPALEDVYFALHAESVNGSERA
jgi:ABC-2 type transport system ATP-binding protein